MEMQDVEQSANIADSDVDALLQSIEQTTNNEIPMTHEEPKQEAPAQPQQTAAEIEFAWNGKQIKAPIDKAKQWAAQGYDYAQKMAEFNQRQSEIQQKEQRFQEIESRYKPIEEYIQKDPQWWEHVQKSYEQRQSQSPQTSDPVLQKVDEILKSKLGPVEQFIQDQQIKEQARQREAEDQRLNEEISSIRKNYSDLDWDTSDTEGKSLEMRVLEHANKHGISNFRAAFRDFYHDHLVKQAEERGKEQINKDIQKRTKLGLLGTSSTPKKQISQAQDIKTKSYDALLQEALEELGA